MLTESTYGRTVRLTMLGKRSLCGGGSCQLSRSRTGPCPRRKTIEYLHANVIS